MPDRTVPGRLTFDEGGVRLALDGALDPSLEDHSPTDLTTHAIVHGRTLQQQAITVFTVRATQISWSSSGLAVSYSAGAGVVGGLLEADQFQAAFIQFDWLPAWANSPRCVDASNFASISVDLRHKVWAAAGFNGGYVDIEAGMEGTWGTNVDVSQFTRFRVTLGSPLSIEELLNRQVRVLSDLLALCLDRPVRHTALHATPANAHDTDLVFEIFYRGGDSPGTELPTSLDILAMSSHTLLWAKDSPIELGALLERWFPFHEKRSQALVPLLGRLYAPFMYAEHELGSTVIAAEALHKLCFTSRQLPKADHAARVAAVIDAAVQRGVEDGIKTWAERVLKASNYKPLHERLSELVAASGSVGTAILTAAPEFAQNLVRLRTGAAHGGAAPTTLSHVERYWHEQALKWVIRTQLIGELIEESAQIQQRVTERESFKFAMRRLADPGGTD